MQPALEQCTRTRRLVVDKPYYYLFVGVDDNAGVEEWHCMQSPSGGGQVVYQLLDVSAYTTMKKPWIAQRCGTFWA
jgi:hypothetical protein